MGLCQDPCEFHEVCAATAKCQAKQHRPICSCPPDHEGNPMVNCTPIVTSKIYIVLYNTTETLKILKNKHALLYTKLN